MYSISTVAVIAAIALLIGTGVGILLSRRLTPDSRRQRELERNLDQLLKRQKDYQHEVVAHFSDTAALLNNLAESYRDVHNHLASGASNLCDDPTGAILPQFPESAMDEIATQATPATVQAPLDYAPKNSPFETGVLNEEFGLDKQSPEQEPSEFAEKERASRQA